MKREARKSERERGGCISDWMVVKGGGVAGLEEAEDNKIRSKLVKGSK